MRKKRKYSTRLKKYGKQQHVGCRSRTHTNYGSQAEKRGMGDENLPSDCVRFTKTTGIYPEDAEGGRPTLHSSLARAGVRDVRRVK